MGKMRRIHISHISTELVLMEKILVDLTPETGNHSITLSASENYFIDNYSQPDVPNVIVLRNLNGKIISTLEKTDVSRLQATGWKPPIPITVKAHDGKSIFMD